MDMPAPNSTNLDYDVSGFSSEITFGESTCRNRDDIMSGTVVPA
jgi:hypothetical protein